MVAYKILDSSSVAKWIVLCLVCGAMCKKMDGDDPKISSPVVIDETTTVAVSENSTSISAGSVANTDVDINDTVLTMEPETEPDHLSTTEGDSTVFNVTKPEEFITLPDEPDEDACDRNPCLNGGVCHPDHLHPAHLYECRCRKGFWGQRCQMEDKCVKDKDGVLCRGGSCVFSEDQESRLCRCFFGTVWDEGKGRCSEPRLPCLPNPCQNAGSCKEEKNGNYSCACAKGYDGPDCGIRNRCGRNDDCGHNGECRTDEKVKAKYCVCDPGYYFSSDNQECEAVEVPCIPNPCQNGGTCETVSSTHYNCTCIDHYTGKTCAVLDECGDGCENGHCERNSASIQCVCNNGYYWDEQTTTCKEAHTVCDTDPCGVGSMCMPLPQNRYNCTCTEGYEGQQCDDLDYCVTDGGIDFCAGAECTNKLFWDIARETFYCACADGQHFDYVRRTCRDTDLCPLMKCGVNEKCENSECTCMAQYKWNNSSGKCEQHICPSNPCPVDGLSCFEGAGIADYNCACQPGEAFNGTHCNSGARCLFPSLNECGQICKDSKDGYNCSCLKHHFQLNDDNRTCTYLGNETCSNKTCNMGTCLKTKDGENCVCPPGYTEVDGNCKDLCAAGSLPKGFCPSNKCESTSNGFRCKCEGKYVLSIDKVTCTARRMCSESEEGWKTCSVRNAICTEDWSSDEGYKCACAKGLIEMEDGMCQDICSIEAYQMKCSALGAECNVNERGKATCKCPPLFEPFEEGTPCQGPAPVSYIWSLPLSPTTYKMAQSNTNRMARQVIADDALDNDKLETDIRQAVEKLVPGFQHLNVLFCRLKKDAMVCKFEIQFSPETEEEYLKRLTFPEICGTTEDQASSCIIPPSLVLRMERFREFVRLQKTDPCDWDVKDALCSPETNCKSSMDPPSFNCTCKPGFEFWKKSYPFNSTLSSAESCKDIDECSLGNPCPQNMDCHNTIGSYDCSCSPGYRLDKDSSTKKCVAICNPNPCTHGTCSERHEHDFDCKCDAGFAGTSCDFEDENFKRAHTNTIIVGVVLGGVLLIVLILSFAYISKLKKKKSMDDPGHILYGTEMTERRNMDSGVVNNAYQRQ